MLINIYIYAPQFLNLVTLPYRGWARYSVHRSWATTTPSPSSAMP